MLTEQLIKSNSVLAGLTPEQIKAIETLSENDEKIIIGNKVAEIHTMYDNDLESIFGVRKPAGTKTYHFMKDKFNELKSQGDTTTLKTEIDTLKREKADLEKLAKTGGDAVLTKQVEDLTKALGDKEKALSDLRNDIKVKETDYLSQISKKDEELVTSKIESEINGTLAGLKFKALDQSIIDTMLATAKQSVLQTGKPEFQKDEKGNTITVFRDENGNIIANPANLQKPFTAGELVLSKLTPILEPPRNVTGTGSEGGQGGSGGGTIAKGSFKTKLEASNGIAAHLAEKGIAKTDPKYDAEFQTLYKEAVTDDMPLK